VTIQTTDPDRLYDLLPALHRVADETDGGGLQALLGLIGSQADDIRADLFQLWDDFFIETSQDWVIPYIGDLVSNIPLHDLDVYEAAQTAEELFPDLVGPDLAVVNPIRLRADVAKTIYYRRRKGTPLMLEELARDVTGWDARVVEFFQILGWNQHLEHLRPDANGQPDLRLVDTGDRVGGPWDTASHTVDVRAIDAFEGWYGIPNIGFFLWRLRAMKRIRSVPRLIGGSTWRFTFSPLGQDVPIFSEGNGPLTGSGRATELSVDAPIRPAAFYSDLAAMGPGLVASSDFYGPDGAARLIVYANGVEVPASSTECTNLDAWQFFAQPTGTTIGIDVARGRLILPTGRAGQDVRVTFCEGVSMDLGGGAYSRAKWLPETPPAPMATPVVGGGNALELAIAARPTTETVFRIDDDLSYLLTTDITLAAGERLTILAKDETRPHVRLATGSIGIQAAGSGGILTLNGLLVEGGLRVDGDLDTLRLLHTTLVPGRSVEQEAAGPAGPSLVVAPTDPLGGRINTDLKVQIAFSIVGALRIPSHVTRLWLLDSIVDGIEKAGTPKDIAVADATNTSGPPAHIERSTLLGTSRFFDLQMASETIFTGRVQVDRRQVGCVRFSYVTQDSATPQQYRCQPGLEVAEESERAIEEANASGVPLPVGWDVALAAAVDRWLVPGFEDDRYGRPDYVQLRRTTPLQIRTGAEDGSEMGVYCLLKQPQREANLPLRLDEYLPIGLEAGLITVT
jgi:hypothetical protein